MANEMITVDQYTQYGVEVILKKANPQYPKYRNGNTLTVKFNRFKHGIAKIQLLAVVGGTYHQSFNDSEIFDYVEFPKEAELNFIKAYLEL
jgi:hypothetical protein